MTIEVVNEKGSAEAATSPSRGSNIRYQENAVNKRQATIPPAGSARVPFDYERAFCKLEDPILDTSARVNALCVMADLLQGSPMKGGGYLTFGEHEVDALRFLIGEVRLAVQALDATWTEDQPSPQSVLVRFDDLDEQAQIDTLIGSHRDAVCELEAATNKGDCSGTEYRETEWYKRAEANERRAFETLLNWRPKTVARSADRLRYLYSDPASHWANFAPEPGEYSLLLSSMSEAWAA